MIGTGLTITQLAARLRAGSGPPPAPPATSAPDPQPDPQPQPQPDPQPSTRFASFPALSAAYAAGRAVISIVGDSTTFGLGAGSGGFYGTSGGAYLVNPAHYLRAGLAAAGLTAIDGCFVTGSMNANGDVDNVLAYRGGGLAATGMANAGSAFDTPYPSPWGTFLGGNNPGATVTCDPGFAWDRAELFAYSKSNALLDFRLGDTVFDTQVVGEVPAALKYAVRHTATALPLTVAFANYDVMLLGALRLWNSAQAHVQVETLGCPGWTAADWCGTGRIYAPLTAVPALGSHLYIVNLGFNDANQGRTAAAFKADLKTLAATMKATGADVLLAVPHAAGGNYTISPAYAAAIGETAAELGLPAPIDLRAIGLAGTDYYDDVHLRATGYARIGAAYTARLTA